MQRNFEKYMHHCLELAGIALQNGDPPVGAILVFEDTIIGKGIECGKSTGDITNHAEILAIRDALKNGYSTVLHQAKMFTTHEPCIMCSYLIRHHKIPHIIYGVSVDTLGGFTSKFDLLCTEDVPKWGKKPLITGGICEAKCKILNERFLKGLKY
jgi:tRNA(adenine34) deaminase